MTDLFIKSPAALLDYQIDWSSWLGTDTITSSEWSAPDALTVESSTNSTTAATIWLSGGTAGHDYLVSNTITTAGGRTDKRSFKLSVVER